MRGVIDSLEVAHLNKKSGSVLKKTLHVLQRVLVYMLALFIPRTDEHDK